VPLNVAERVALNWVICPAGLNTASASVPLSFLLDPAVVLYA
jgi:hypothetical protein